ncbi:MAG: class II aldolase/adducin family protein [Hyphomicrobiaceae bacterium]
MQQARYDIAAAHRLGARMGLNEGFNGGHFTLMAPGRTDLVLTIANGTHWAEATPDSVIAVDMSGNTVEGEGQIERSAFHIHSGLHRARPDLRCFMHAHMPYATALSMLEDNRLKTYGQQSLRFYSKCAYYDHYGALAHSGDEGERMSAVLGNNKSVVFLGQHGVITGGTTVGRAFHDLYYLERACMNQVMALSTNQPLREVPEAMALKAERQYDSQRDEAELHFASLKRVLASEVPAFAQPPIGLAAAAE